MEMKEYGNKAPMSDHVHHHGSVNQKFDGDMNEMHNHEHVMMNMQSQNHEHMMMNMHSHSSTFAFVTKSDFLIEGINIDSIEGIIIAMLFTMVITLLQDMLKFVLHQWEPEASSRSAHKKKENLHIFLKTLIHILSVFLGYTTMLCVMSMNVWLTISVVISSGIAHLLIRPFLSMKLQNHVSSTTKCKADKENMELLYDGNIQREKNQICKTVNISTATPLITCTNND